MANNTSRAIEGWLSPSDRMYNIRSRALTALDLLEKAKRSLVNYKIESGDIKELKDISDHIITVEDDLMRITGFAIDRVGDVYDGNRPPIETCSRLPFIKRQF